MLALGSLNPTVKPNNLLKVVYHPVHCMLHLHTFLLLLIDLPDDTASDGEYWSNGSDSDMLESGEKVNSLTNKCSDLSEGLFFNC